MMEQGRKALFGHPPCAVATGSQTKQAPGSRETEAEQTGMRCVNEDRVGNYSFEITLREGNQQF